MKIESSNIYTQNLAGLNSAKAIKENNENFDVILENELKTKTIKAEDIKNGSDLDEYLMFKYIGELGHERGTGVWFLSMVSAIQVAIDKYGSGDNDLWPSIEKSRENYKSIDDLKQDIINRISIIQSDRYDYTPPNKSKAEYEMQKQDTINALSEIYKELFNEEPVIPKYETLIGEGAESGIDISTAIKEFLNKPFENEEEEELIELIKELYKDKEKQESTSKESKIQESELKTLQDIGLKESFDIEKLALKERFTKEKQSIDNFSLSLLLQSL